MIGTTILGDILPLVIGIFMIAAFFSHSKKANRFIKNGVEVEGIVFDIISSGSISNVDAEHPVIRFLTTDELWITETYDIGTLPTKFKRGQRVTVIYNAEDPKDFILKSDKSTSYVPVVILVFGVLVLIWGVYRMLQRFCNF